MERFVSNYGNWTYLASLPAITIGIPITGTIPNAVCHAFYIARCWTLSHNWFFLLPAIASLVVTVGSGIVQTVAVALVDKGNIKSLMLIFTSSNVTLASGLTCDLFITSFTCYYLVRRKTGFSQADILGLRLVKCSIESAAGSTVVTLINLILNNTSGNSQWFLFPSIVLTQVYGCSLLYTNFPQWLSYIIFVKVHFGSIITMPGILVEIQTIRHEDDIIIDINPTVSENTRQEESKAPTETSSAEAVCYAV
ncbi:hypothetical protein M422DRAFT_266228 [Sphaerobolus stellatus SS14]|uniref:DUF6534 domain-containing protein n=1 Tax=Sphaerobolus stellatus (strain SS14) TaxID=990650 RepID=A0A0C9V3G6_SPHS4|nr:hypothetical protein M422DRAFT_266228 [Sphaerobolus stellatus SS14]